jgi:hypothetical protein
MAHLHHLWKKIKTVKKLSNLLSCHTYFICAYLGTFLCIYVYICTWIHTYMHILILMCSYIDIFMYIYVHRYICIQMVCTLIDVNCIWILAAIVTFVTLNYSYIGTARTYVFLFICFWRTLDTICMYLAGHHWYTLNKRQASRKISVASEVSHGVFWREWKFFLFWTFYFTHLHTLKDNAY